MRGVLCNNGELVMTDELEVRAPNEHEVRVRVLASGICHSDISMMKRKRDAPVVLGHEGAGVVAECGEGVTSVGPGDAVAVGSQKPCGECRACRRSTYSLCPTAFGQGDKPFTWRGQPVYSMARVSSFASEIVVHEQQLLPYHGLRPEAAALVGCAVSTGYGNVRNVAEVTEGDVVVVIGVGGIGVNAIQVARLQGAQRVIAVDIRRQKEEVAATYGADGFVLAGGDEGAGELADRVRVAAGAPIDAVIECSGVPVAIEAAVEAAGRGGRVAVVGMPSDGAVASFDINALMLEGKTIGGALNGACDPLVDLPEIMRLAEAGRLKLEPQVSRVWPLEDIEDAISAVMSGEIVRAALDLT